MTNLQQTLWTEKYRPTTLDEVVGHDAAVTQFKRFLDDDGPGMPHVLLSGPPGVGKTAVIGAFARDLYGETWQDNLREFNASDDRGIDVVREQIKEWCRRAPADGHAYKIVFLDEADQLTSDAQPALRRIIEQYSDNTRFALTCNYSSEIIGPLQSRTASMHFSRLADEDIRALVEHVAEEESLTVEEAALAKVVRSARGQARDALLTLQRSAQDGQVTEDEVTLFTGVVDDQLVEEILVTALEGDIDTAQRRLDVELLKAGADPHALVDSIFRQMRKLDMTGEYRALSFKLLGTIEDRLQRGLRPNVQLHALLAHLYMAQGSAMAQQETGGDVDV